MKVKIKPKLDANLGLVGLLITDADTAIEKLKRAETGILKGLYVFEKNVPSGTVYIANGAEFPNIEAVDLLLYLIWLLEKQGWERVLRIESLNKLAKEVFGIKQSGLIWNKKIERILVIWKNHTFYFDNSFLWNDKKVKAYFGVIENFIIDSQGRGKPTKIEIVFDEKFIEICKETNWYRRPVWIEFKKLRKETSKNLYMLALTYKPSDSSKEWNIYMDKDLKYWYRNALNSVANPKHLRPSRIIKRVENAIGEINNETNLRMKLYQTEEGNYVISVEEVAPPGSEKIEIPFEKLSDEDKAILVAYVEAVAKEKKIQNIWGFLHSMTSKQVRIWLRKAKKYF